MSIRDSAPRIYGRSRAVDVFMRGLMVGATLLALIPLVLIIGYVVVRGSQALSVPFFTQTYVPPLAVNDASLPGVSGTPSQDTTVAPTATGDTEANPAATSDTGASRGDTSAGAAPTADPFANIDVGALAGAGSNPTAVASDGSTGAVAPTTDPFANIDVGALSGANGNATATAGNGTTTGAGNQQSEIASDAPQGGVLHGIVGTLLVTGLALLIALPIGVLAGVFLAEFPSNSVATIVRFACDVLSGAPSIVIGVVGYVLIVQRFNAFSGVAGSIALMFLMVPTITRTTEEILKLVPQSTREAALAMGAPMWYSTFTVVIPTALAGIVTGVLLAFARGAGETAPLILTVLGNNELSFDLLKPIAALPLLTYRYTESPFPSENTLAWGTALVLVVLVLGVNVMVRLATRNRLAGR